MELQTRKPNRLKNYDYSQNGAYFITICVQDRKPILSQIIVGEGLAPPVLKLLPFGECIKEQINNLEIRYENVKIDNYVIMPNHIHILMRIENQTGGASPSPTVSDIICAFKSLSTLECKKLLPIDILFQRSYHDHIIRDNIDYQQIWQYIDENPTKWADTFGIATTCIQYLFMIKCIYGITNKKTKQVKRLRLLTKWCIFYNDMYQG